MLYNFIRKIYKSINAKAVSNNGVEKERMPLEQQRAFLASFAEPKDDFERSYYKYQCFFEYCYYDRKWQKVIYNIGAMIVLPFVRWKFKKKQVTPYGKPADAVIENVPRLPNADVIPEELKGYFVDSIGFVSVSVGITVPPTPQKFLDENPLAVCTDLYNELPADATGFRPVGAPVPKMDGLVPFSPFAFYIERKLLIHNMGHATMAYLGYLKGYNYIYEVANDPEIKYILVRALYESARALAKRHGASLDGLMGFVENLVTRLDNPLLEDSLLRVGKDTKRKLAAGDRLGGGLETDTPEIDAGVFDSLRLGGDDLAEYHVTGLDVCRD